MQPKTDGAGNTYFDVANIRITCVPKTWTGQAGIRIQAYKGQGDSLHQGAELPIPDKQTAFDFIKAVHLALEHNGI